MTELTNMILHKNTYRILLGIGILASIDLLTRKLWLVLLYLSAWSILLFRKSKSNPRSEGLTSPVTGEVSNISKVRANDTELTSISIITKPIIDPQNFRVLPSDRILSLRYDGNSRVLSYESGAMIVHTPNFGLASFDLDHGNIESFQQDNNDNYGYSVLGCRTTVTLPVGWCAKVISGQKVINGETIIGGQEC